MFALPAARCSRQRCPSLFTDLPFRPLQTIKPTLYGCEVHSPQTENPPPADVKSSIRRVRFRRLIVFGSPHSKRDIPRHSIPHISQTQIRENGVLNLTFHLAQFNISPRDSSQAPSRGKFCYVAREQKLRRDVAIVTS